METSIWDGVIIGGAGGALAGVTVYLIQYLHGITKDYLDKNKVYNWLTNNTSDIPGNRYRSTRAIASWNNLTEDRTRYICSIENKIYLSTGQKEDMWSIHERENRDANTGEII